MTSEVSQTDAINTSLKAIDTGPKNAEILTWCTEGFPDKALNVDL